MQQAFISPASSGTTILRLTKKQNACWDTALAAASPVDIPTGWEPRTKQQQWVILIDERLCEPQRLGRLRFTCGHELAHWVLHKKLYTGTGDVAAYDGNSSTDESNGIIERQADAMATALLMPLPQVKKCFYRLRSGRSTEQLIYEMSQIFAVSKQAMQIRLQSHNLI